MSRLPLYFEEGVDLVLTLEDVTRAGEAGLLQLAIHIMIAWNEVNPLAGNAGYADDFIEERFSSFVFLRLSSEGEIAGR
jgi:hypothetical protein